MFPCCKMSTMTSTIRLNKGDFITSLVASIQTCRLWISLYSTIPTSTKHCAVTSLVPFPLQSLLVPLSLKQSLESDTLSF